MQSATFSQVMEQGKVLTERLWEVADASLAAREIQEAVEALSVEELRAALLYTHVYGEEGERHAAQFEKWLAA